MVFPGNAEEISAVLRLANEHLFPVIPRGAGSGMSGGSVPARGGLVLVLNRLNRIIKIDRENFLAVVEPGVVNKDLQQAAEAQGLFYPPDPASMNFSTLGGNVAECAGGARAVKYGVTRDYVLGLTAVLPTGEILKTGVQTIKSVVGYDLTRLLVGSEGTLGIITEIVLKLLPKPETRLPVLAFFSGIDQAARAVVEILHTGILPSTLEFMDQPSIRAVEDYLHLGLPREAEALLLIEVDGNQEEVERQSLRVAAACERLGAVGTRRRAPQRRRKKSGRPAGLFPRPLPAAAQQDQRRHCRAPVPDSRGPSPLPGNRPPARGAHRQLRPCRRRQYPRQCHV